MAAFYIYNADVYCEECGEDIKSKLRAEGCEPDHPDDEHTYDSSEWPKGPYGDDESDSPQHCGSYDKCLDPYILEDGSKVGKFLENDLTTYGVEYVKESHRDRPSEVTKMWMDFYGLNLNLTIDQRRSRLRARLEELSSEDAFQIVDTLVITVLSYTLEDGELDNLSDCASEMLDDLHNHGLDPTRF